MQTHPRHSDFPVAPPSLRNALQDEWVRFPTDESTLDSPRPERTCDPGSRRPETVETSWGRRGLMFGLGVAVWTGLLVAGLQIVVTSPGPSTSKPGWVMLKLQAAALDAPQDAALRQRALDASFDFLAVPSAGPWREIVRHGCLELVVETPHRCGR